MWQRIVLCFFVGSLLIAMLALSGCETVAYVLGGMGAGFGTAKMLEEPKTTNNFDGHAQQVVEAGVGGSSLLLWLLLAGVVLRNLANFPHLFRALRLRRWGLALWWLAHIVILPGRPPEATARIPHGQATA